ncbi:PepSY domain-containing protein [Methanobacterium sp.]|uniref:PepSY domain-containing protein n=1 Tax=Methanobacterium sp. TaxID=2164 RepID=UPI003C738934
MVNNNGIVIAIVIIILVAIAGIYLAAQNTGSDNNTANMSSNPPQNASPQNNTTMVNNGTNSSNNTNSTNNTNINNTNTTVSAQQAQKIAQAYILESGAEAGTPTLNTWSDGRLVWSVPIIGSNGEKEGVSIYIDAQTGARLG